MPDAGRRARLRARLDGTVSIPEGAYAGQTRRMTPRPLWLLDVDGVLNAVTGKPDRSVWPDWRAGVATADRQDWPIWYSRTVTETVRRVHEQGLAEVQWLTTWGAWANGSLRHLLDLPELAVAAEPPQQGRRWQRRLPTGTLAACSTH